MPIPKAVALLALGASVIAPAPHHNGSHLPCGHPVTAKSSRPFENRVWDTRRWERGSPGSPALRAWHRKLGCAGPHNRRTMVIDWQRAKLRYGRYRAYRRIAPYPGGGQFWAVPYAIVYCESRGLWTAYNPSGAEGPYQLLGHGAPYPAVTWQEKMANHRIAGQLYREEGTAPWASSQPCWG